jgi:NAD(P)-dependent dehydrogenase (short-subunit alcohol dehydrogenase family)
MLTGKNILITNVTHFIGLVASRYLTDKGAKVVVCDPTFADADILAKFRANYPDFTALGETEPADIVAAVGRVDVLVNNDAFPAIRAPVEEAKAQDMRDGLEAMVVEPLMMSGAVLPQMKERSKGKIIFMTSASVFHGLANYSMYVAARAAANGIAISLAQEVARNNIQVNAIAPNYVENPDYFPPELLANEEAYAKMVKNIPLGRLGKPEEISALIAFYAGDESDFLTGHIVPAAGGWEM